MKKTLMALTILACSGLAYAGENSYSYQGQARTYRVKPSQRHIPEPSSWTPLERIPQARVQIVRRDQPKRLGGGFASPTFSGPSFSSPSFSNPSVSSPSTSSPAFSAPGFSNPSTSSPSFSAPSTSSPSMASPSFAAPAASSVR